MIKIAYISTIAFSDVDLSFLQEAKQTADYTYIVCISPYDKASCAIDLREVELQPGFNKASLIPSLQKYHVLINLNKFYIFYNPAKHAYEWNVIKYFRVLRNYLKNENFDIIHMTFVPSIVHTFLFRCFRQKLVITLHDPIPHSSATYKMEEYNRKVAFRVFNKFILLNKAQEKDFITAYGLNKNRVTVFHSSLSAYNYLHIYDTHVENIRPYILFFGNITAYKGLEYLFDAMVKVHDTVPGIRLIAAGRGNYYFDISKYSGMPYIEIMNKFINDDELATLVDNSQFVVIPYVEATQSGVVMTAYAFNKPCVATRVGGLPEMVVDGQYGLTVPPKDSASLANAMIEMLKKPSLIKIFSENIKTDYQDGERSWKSISRDMSRIYSEVNPL